MIKERENRKQDGSSTYVRKKANKMSQPFKTVQETMIREVFVLEKNNQMETGKNK